MLACMKLNSNKWHNAMLSWEAELQYWVKKLSWEAKLLYLSKNLDVAFWIVPETEQPEPKPHMVLHSSSWFNIQTDSNPA